MPMYAGFLSALLLGLSTHAAVPYGALENLRRQNVATRVALDNPEDAWMKSCGLKLESFAVLGGNLSLAMDAAGRRWQKQSLQESDWPELKVKIESCERRGSCQVYERYLTSVKTEQALKSRAAELIKSLEKKLESLPAASYKKALATVPEPCSLLKDLINLKN